MEKLVTRCSPTAPARNRSCQARTRDVRPGDDCVSHAIAPMHVYAHVDTQSRRKLTSKEAQCMNRSHSMPAWPGGGTTATTRPARQASAAASTRRRHAARAPPPKASRLPPTARHDVAGMRVAHRPPPAAQSDANTRAAFSTATRMRTGTDESKRASSVRASVRECRRRAAAPGRARVNRRAWDALAPRSRRRLRHRHCRRPRPAARARRSSRAASAPAARAPDRRAQAA